MIERIGAIVAAEHGVLIGDAPGADAEIQGLLAGYNYEHVGVFHAGIESAKDPKYTVIPQKERVAARESTSRPGRTAQHAATVMRSAPTELT